MVTVQWCGPEGMHTICRDELPRVTEASNATSQPVCIPVSSDGNSAKKAALPSAPLCTIQQSFRNQGPTFTYNTNEKQQHPNQMAALSESLLLGDLLDEDPLHAIHAIESMLFDSDSGYDSNSPRDYPSQSTSSKATPPDDETEFVIDFSDWLNDEAVEQSTAPTTHSTSAGLKRKRTECTESDGCSPAHRRQRSDSPAPVAAAPRPAPTAAFTLAHEGTAACFSCHIEQGTGERQASSSRRYDAWLRSMNRLTFFNGELELGPQGTELAHRISAAFASLDPSVAVSLSCSLLYADTQEVVPLRTEGGCEEKITMIKRCGNTREGYTDFTSNTVHLSNNGVTATAATLPTYEYLDVTSQGSKLKFSFKFSTNVTSRRHGMRNRGRQFCWRIAMHVYGLSEQPVTFTTLSHHFTYVSRPVARQATTTEQLSLLEAITDGRPGDLVTCLAPNVHHPHILAELGHGNSVVATLQRAVPSKQAFICRLPPANLCPRGQECWIRLVSSRHSCEPSDQLPITLN